MILKCLHFILSYLAITVSTQCKENNLREHQNYHLLPRYPVCGRGYLQPGVGVKSRVMGGEKAVLGEFPWMARLTMYFSNTSKNCGGSLISERYVISAAHCIVQAGPVRRVKVILGELKLDTDPDCEGTRCAPHYITNSVTHLYLDSKYSRMRERSSYRDFMLLRLKDVVSFSDFVKPICLPFDCVMKNATFAGVSMTMAGWGRKEFNEKSKTLWKLKSKIVDWDECLYMLHPFNIKLNRLNQCFNISTTRSSCKGDSGGPVMLQTRTSTKCQCTVRGTEFPLGPTHYVHYLIAVVSFGVSCLEARPVRYPRIQTRVAPYLKWILDRLSI